MSFRGLGLVITLIPTTVFFFLGIELVSLSILSISGYFWPAIAVLGILIIVPTLLLISAKEGPSVILSTIISSL